MAARKRASRAQGPAAMPADERKAKLEKVVRNRTREGRAEVKSQTEFTAVLVGGQPVNHRLHALATVVATAIGAGLGRVAFGEMGLLAGLAAGGGYGLFWAFLHLTGGLWFDNLAVDEQGVVTSEIAGRPPDFRGRFLKVAIPVAVIACCLYLAVTLGHDLVYPPPPHCNTKPPPENACLLLPNIADALAAVAPTATPGSEASASASPSPGVSPAGSPGPSAAPAATTKGTPLSVDDAIALERIVRGFSLFFTMIVLVTATWFLRRMLTGQWVVAIAPVRRRDG